MRRVLLVLPQGGRGSVAEVDGRIVGRHERVGGILGDPREDLFPVGEELVELREFLCRVSLEAEGVAAVGAVWGPLSHLLGVERGLRSVHGGAPQSCRFAGHGIGALRIGEVGMKGEPERRTGSRRTAGRGDALFIDVPLGGFAADELQSARGVVQRPFHWRRLAVGGGFGDEAVFHGDDGNAGLEYGGEHPGEAAETTAAHPTAAVNKEEQGRRLVGFGFPEMQDLLEMRAVGDVVCGRIREQRIGGEKFPAFLRPDLAHEEMAPADFAPVGLQHDRTLLGQRFAPVPIVLHHRAFDHGPGIEPDPGAGADLDDAQGIPLAEGLVGDHHRIAPEGLGRVVEKSAGALVRFAIGLRGIENLVDVPDLDLRRAAQIDPAVGVRHGLVFDEQFDVAEFLVGRGIRSRAVVHQFAVLHGPVLRKLGALLLEIGFPLLALQLADRMGIQAIPPGEVLAIEDGPEALWRFRIGRAQRGDRKQTENEEAEGGDFHESESEWLTQQPPAWAHS